MQSRIPIALLACAISTGLLAQHKVTDETLAKAASDGANWITYGGDPEETRHSAADQITPENASKLGLVWSYDVGEGGGNQEATPLVWNGTMYSITNWSIVFALDAATGEEKWRFDPEVNQTTVRPRICCGVVQRGIALYEGLVIAPVTDGRLIALDANTGRPVWESRVSWAQDNYTLTMAPRIAGGRVIIGAAGGELGTRGFFSAFDAKTGDFLWKFYTVPGDPSKPYENEWMKRAAETWPKDFDYWTAGGGGSVWDGISYDPELDIVYVGTGNGGPWPAALRGSEGLTNLYTCSIVAVRGATGELVWYFQTVPGDSWDLDAVQQMVLADLEIDGQPRKVLMQAGKNGFLHMLDRTTGEFITGFPFTKVTWASGLDPVTGKPIVRPEALYGKEPVRVGPISGHNWAPMSFDAKLRLLYIPMSVNSEYTFSVDQDFEFKSGEYAIGLGGGQPTVKTPPAIGPIPREGAPRGALVAFDPVTHKERWRNEAGGATGGGALSTDGNLVFQTTMLGELFVLRADTGEKLFEVKTGLRGAGPPITYEVNGRQYVTFQSGAGNTRGRNAEPGHENVIRESKAPKPKMFTFALGGDPFPVPAK